MKRFLLFLTLILQIVSITILQGQILPSLVRIDPPSYVQVNERFFTSLIFTIDVVTTDDVIIKFKKPSSIGIISATLKSWLGEESIPISPNGDSKNEFILRLNSERLALDANTIYQVLLECYTPKPLSLRKNQFVWEKDIKDEPVISFDITKESEIEELTVYEKQKTAGNYLEFNENTNLKILLKNLDEENLYIEFWMKSVSEFNNFLSMKSRLNEDTLLTISKNEFGFIAFPLRDIEIERHDNYLGFDNWNYIGINLTNDLEGSKASVYVNSVLSYSTFLKNDFGLNDLVLHFRSSDENSEITLDRLKIWKFSNNLALADKNKHFLNYEADSSTVIFQTSFDSPNELTGELDFSNLKIIGNNLSYAKSDAPLFSKAPKLTVKIGSSYNSIVWYVQEFSVAKEFEIERSISGGEFISIYSTLAEDDPLKIYYYTDEQIKEHEVAYYRVKQINQDGTQVYSAEVKIGNKEIDEFKLGQNYPNPFNPITSIYVEVIVPSEFKVNVYDLVGNTVAKLYDGYLTEGLHTFEFDGTSLPSGIYFYEVISPASQSVKKMILAK